MAHPISSITIVGGGTSGWLAALFFATRFKTEIAEKRMSITLVESDRIPIIGVGESVSPSMVETLRALDVNESDFIRETDASFKLAGYFLDWEKSEARPNSSWINPFVAFTGAGLEFERFETGRTDANGNEIDYARTISPCRDAIEQRLGPRRTNQGDFDGVLRYAYHTDAGQFAPFLRKIAEQRGVNRIGDDVIDCKVNDRGHITALKLEERGDLPVEFVIDATGFAGILLNRALGVPMIDYGRHLINDRAVVAQLAYADENEDIEPATRSTALSAGWAFRVPLYSRTGNGYIYSSQHTSDDEATQEFASYLKDPNVEEKSRIIKMRVGRSAVGWSGNCVALGLSAGFVEPLESSAIYTVETSLKWLFHYFPDSDFSPHLAKRYNERTERMYDEVVDYIVLHYFLSGRDDSPYWREVKQNITVPDRLRENIELWKHSLPVRGDFPSVTYFDEVTYTAALMGKHFYAGNSLHLERALDRNEWEQRKRSIARTHEQALATLPSHRQLLKSIRER